MNTITNQFNNMSLNDDIDINKLFAKLNVSKNTKKSIRLDRKIARVER